MDESPAIFVVFAGLFGLLLGSFLNVCIYRIPRDLSVVHPRSFCPHCEQGVAWYDNIPLVSYLYLRGRCRHCRHLIGWRYPLVEAATAALFALTTLEYGWTTAALKWMLFEAIMIVLFWTDLDERILPDELTIGGTIAGLLLAFFVPTPGIFGAWLLPSLQPAFLSLLNSVAAACILTLPIAFVAWIYGKVRHREGLGFGDLKLLILLGVFLGLQDGVRALLIASISGSLIGILYVLITRKDASTYWLPFGTFLCAAGAILPLFHRL